MISGWLGDRSGWTGVRFAELDRSSFVDRTVVRGSERWFVGRSSGSWIGVDRSSFSLVRGSFGDRSDVRGSELSGSWIGVDRSSGFWVGARSLWFVDRLVVRGSELTVIGSDWVEALVAWIGARYLFRCVAVRGSFVVLLCVRLFSVSLLSSLCVAVRGDVIQK